MRAVRSCSTGAVTAAWRSDPMPIYALGADEPDIHPDAYVHPDAVVIGKVTIGAESTIWPCAASGCTRW